MSIISISLCSRLGSPILARNFSKISFSRLEQLLSRFTHSISSTQQHSYVETNEAVFVFQPLNQMYLVLIAAKSANILQCIECLHLVGRYLTGILENLDENEVLAKVSEIVFALDEIVQLGSFSGITIPQINSNLIMHSQEEELQELIEKNKIQEARQVGKLKMKQLEQDRKESFNKSGYKSESSISSGSGFRETAEVTTERIDLNLKSKSVRSGKGLSLKKY